MSFVDRLTGSVIYLAAGGFLAVGVAAIDAHVTRGPGAVVGPAMLGTCVGWVVCLSLVYGLTPRALEGGRPGATLTVGAITAGVAAGIGVRWLSETSALQLTMGIPVALLAVVLGIAVFVLAERWQQSRVTPTAQRPPERGLTELTRRPFARILGRTAGNAEHRRTIAGSTCPRNDRASTTEAPGDGPPWAPQRPPPPP